jgi:hypothetical protein
MGASARRLLLPLMVVCGLSVQGHSQQSSVRTILCEALAHASQFDGKRVQFHARYSGTFEGMWLGDGKCDAGGEVVLPFDRQLQARYGVEQVVTRLSKKFGIDDVLRDKEWEQFDFSRQRIYTGMTQPTAGCCDYIMADFDGILIIKRNFRMKNGFGNGWGHLKASRFLLVLRSVSNVTPHSCAGTQSNSSAPTMQFPTQPTPDLLSPTKSPD